ncbi:MAG: hypothetical protein NTZ19_00735 [Bacteroidetes bacterium]|nr:hypothetical protein [Bacteroidota bacterium]
MQSCTKKNADTPVSTSKWTLNGITYDFPAVVFGSNTLVALEGNGDYIHINFSYPYYSYTTRPLSGVYTIVPFASIIATISNSACTIDVGNQYSINNYGSTGLSGDKVTVSVSAAGKTTVTFNNITVKNSTTTTTVTGVISEE